jgi:amino acid permease
MPPEGSRPPSERPLIEGPPTFTRESVVAGMPARRASTLLFAIENRTALMAARARRAMARFETEHTVADRERQFLGALAEGRTPPLKPTLQDLDRHAREWRDLVPQDPALRAALLGRIGAKYGLPPQARNVAAALGAGDAVVVEAYLRQANDSIDTLRAAPLPLAERLRWLRDKASRRLESLPPFWLAFSLTLTETVGVGVLALPIAFAGFGATGATLLLIVFGLLNILTVAALVEAITRNGQMRYGLAFFGRLIGDYLGRPGNMLAMPALFVLEAAGLVVCLVGFGTTIGAVTGLPVILCAGALFAAVTVIMWRDSLNVTVAVAVALGFVNLALIVGMSLIAFASPAAPAGEPVEVGQGAQILELIFGVGLGAYFGHTSAGHSAKVVLARDPGGRQFLAGNVAAMATAMVIYVLFVVGVTSTVGAGGLAGFEGTALTPLAERAGPLIDVMGTIYVLFTMGLGAMFVSLGIYNQVGELLHGAGTIGRRVHDGGHGLEFAVRSAPGILIFLGVVALLQVGQISMTEVLALVGTLTVPLLGGVFPMLVLVAARRRGERVPGRPLGALGHPIVAALVGVLFLLGVAVFGLWVWTDPLQRAAALAVTAAIAILAVLSVRNGAFAPRTVVEYRVEATPPPLGFVSVVSAGTSVPARVHVRDASGERAVPDGSTVDAPDAIRNVSVDLPSGVAPETLLWVHTVTADGSSIPTSVGVDVAVGDAPPARLDGTVDRLSVPPSDGPTRLTLSLSTNPDLQ